MSAINQGTSASSQIAVADCSTILIVLDQRRKLNFFNRPPPRYTPVSPYPFFTREQLDMRRKAEILKYNKQSSKVGNMTKKQAYSILAKGKANQLSQFAIQQLQNNTFDFANGDPAATCNANVTKPTWSTACGVPGPPVLLQYDPNVPLYNYINDATQDANYSSLPETDYSHMFLYTMNELEYIYEAMDNLVTDICNVNIVVNKNFQTRTLALGNIVNTKYMSPSLVSYSFNIPIGIWMIGFKDQGVINPACDPSGEYAHVDPSYGYLAYQNSCYIKFPGDFKGGATEPPYPGMGFHIDFTNTRPKLSIQFSGLTVTPLVEPTFHSSLDPTIPRFYDVSFVPFLAKNQFYGIQYVGNLIIENVVLPVQPEEVYDVSLTMSYYYDYPMFQEMDLFQTGLFFNLTRENTNVSDGFDYLADPPVYMDMSYSAVPIGDSKMYFQFFDTGTNIAARSPAIENINVASVGPNYVVFDSILGVYTYYDIERIYTDPTTNETTSIMTYNNTGSTYVDRTLQPDTTYVYKITPVYNHMSGTTSTLNPIKTLPVIISGTLGDVTFTTASIVNIHGNYSYYNVRVLDEFSHQTTYSHLTAPTFTDTDLKPGTYYKFYLEPFLSYPDGTTYYDPSTNFLLDTNTYNTYISKAVFGAITPISVTINDISGVFDKITIIRNGINSRVYLYENPVASFTDNDPKLITGATYSYSVVPSRTNTQGNQLDGKQYLVGPVTIP